jgi:hypothetical protein
LDLSLLLASCAVDFLRQIEAEQTEQRIVKNA